ncbi:hypothetical protein LTR36_009799 [Oleoguttula mirabilis]|uniref:Uncharacterized protein n=1 Tax=Oleoguttula mirabilis TaxID=1507867 RepID=A0AAV9J640_9PEZI|nr:hypothetical protein LTR36_009799 [Oleoguttula mirabilis]
MPKVLARDPSWLARPSPGFQLFRADGRQHGQSPVVRYEGPLRRIAHRGTEVIVAVGNELRWSELSMLKDAGERFDRSHGRYAEEGVEDGEVERAYRVLKTPVSRPIQQLSVSPSGDFIAILTSHTCHVAILPAPTHLHSGDTQVLRLKTFQVGPTAHVLEQSPIISALWHPLSPSGNCLVTVTKDACVRLWELDRDNRSTFDEPSLAVDLKKLGTATTTQADFSASKYGASKAFSPDSAEMQVAAACFGGQGKDDEHGWAAMTLWIAMSEGDVYALCPFLPSKWRAPATLKPSLTTSAVAKLRAIGQDQGATDSERRVVDQQCKWLADLDAQDPIVLPGDGDFDMVEVYSRPERPGAIPKLQGPFYVGSEFDTAEITDIHVVAAKINDEALFDDEEDELTAEEGLSVGVVCLATNTSKVHVCLDLEGIEAEWLPTKRSRAIIADDDDGKDLLLFETIELSHPDTNGEGWPTFTASPTDRYELFATTPSGICALDFKGWTGLLEDELAHASEAGADFRLDVLLESARTVVSRPVETPAEPDRGINAAIAIVDVTLGYLLITSAINVPLSAILDIPSETDPYAPDIASPAGALPAPEPRAPYQPAEEFFQPSALPQLIKTANEKKLLGSDLKQQVRFSSATLQLMTEAHRLLSTETHRLGLAASDLFRRCERMRAELHDQIRRVKEIADKVDVVVGEDEGAEADDEGNGGELTGNDRIEYRVNESNERTIELNDRVEALRKRMVGLGGGVLSAREVGFAEEVGVVHRSIEAAGTGAPGAPTEPEALLRMENSGEGLEERERERTGSLAGRFEAVRRLHERLVLQAGEIAARTAQDGGEGGKREGGRVAGGAASEFKRKKLAQVMALLERETALVEGVTERLARLRAAA